MRKNKKKNNRRNPWKIKLWLLVLSHLAGTLNIVSVLAMAPVISSQLNLSGMEFGFLVTAYYGGQAFWSLPSGILVDNFGIGRTLVISHIVMALAAVFLSIATGHISAVWALFLMGIGYSMTNPASGRAVLIWFSPKQRGTAMGIKQVGVPLGGIIAAGSGALVEFFEWNSIMLAAGIFILLNGFFCTYLISEDDGEKETRMPNTKKIRRVIGMRQLHINTILNAFINIGQINFFSFLTLFLREVTLVSQPMASAAMGLAQSTSAFGRVFWGVVCDRWFVNHRRILMALLCGLGSFFLFCMIFVQPSLGGWFGFLLASLLGFTIASYAPVAQAITVEMVSPSLSGSALGYNLMGVFLGGMVGPPIFGAIIDLTGSFEAGWVATSLLCALGTFILIKWFKEGMNA